MDGMIRQQEYVNGLTRMASACSVWIGRSEISAVCLPKEETEAALAKAFGLLPEKAALTSIDRTLPQVFAQWLGGREEKLRDGLLWLLRARLGAPRQVYRLQHEDELLGTLGWGEGGAGYYYFVEDLIVADHADCAVCYYMGNNE